MRQSSNSGTSIYGGSQDMITQNQPGDQRLFMLNHHPENNNDNLLQRSITEGTSRWLIDNEFLKQEVRSEFYRSKNKDEPWFLS